MQRNVFGNFVHSCHELVFAFTYESCRPERCCPRYASRHSASGIPSCHFFSHWGLAGSYPRCCILHYPHGTLSCRLFLCTGLERRYRHCQSATLSSRLLRFCWPDKWTEKSSNRWDETANRISTTTYFFFVFSLRLMLPSFSQHPIFSQQDLPQCSFFKGEQVVSKWCQTITTEEIYLMGDNVKRWSCAALQSLPHSVYSGFTLLLTG